MARASKSTSVVPAKARGGAVGAAIDWREEMAKSAQRATAQAINANTGFWLKTRGGRFQWRDLDLGTEIECIVLDKAIEHQYYTEKFDPDNPANPVCFAITFDPDGITPHEKSEQVQNPTCDGCPQLEWGSAENGKGKACKQVRRISLLALPDQLTVDGVEAADIGGMKIPVMSVKGIDQYFSALAAKGAVWQYVTRIKIVPDPKSQFRIVAELAERNAKPLPEKLYNSIVKRMKEAEKELERPYTPIERNDFEEQQPARGRAAKVAKQAINKAATKSRKY